MILRVEKETHLGENKKKGGEKTYNGENGREIDSRASFEGEKLGLSEVR